MPNYLLLTVSLRMRQQSSQMSLAGIEQQELWQSLILLTG